MRVSDAIWQRIAQEVDTVFYLPGGGCGPLVDALGQSGLRAVCCLHEQSAGFAAVAYSQYRGFGVALVTSGPGSTNIMTPCLAAWVDSTPLLIISGQVMTRWLAMPGMRSRGTQEGPTIEMFKPITKDVFMPRDPIDVLPVLNILIKEAKDGRGGPVVLDVPMDVQNAEL
jgi:acetolactate synthase I/II/III large subunit